MLLDLPPEILDNVVGHLGNDARSLCRLACVCTRLRDAAADVATLNPTLTMRGWGDEWDGSMRQWLAQAKNGRRVASMRVKRCGGDTFAWLGTMINVRTLKAWYCRVNTRIITALPRADKLLCLHIHRLVPRNSDTFTTRAFQRFTSLQELRVTFSPDFDLVLVECLETLRDMRVVEIRGSTGLAILQTPCPSEFLSLHARDWMVTRDAVKPGPRAVRLACDSSDVPLEHLFGFRGGGGGGGFGGGGGGNQGGQGGQRPERRGARVPGCRTLDLACRQRIACPAALADVFPDLETLRISFDSVLMDVPALCKMERLKTLDLRAARCFAVCRPPTCFLPRGIDVRCVAAGRRVDMDDYLFGVQESRNLGALGQ